MKSIWLRNRWLALALAAVPAWAMGEGGETPHLPVLYEATTVLDGQVGTGATGTIGVNMAAGDQNLQANSGALAIGGTSAAFTDTGQIVGPGAFTLPDRSATVIGGSAFQDATGWIGINQAAGASNAQSNSIGVAIGAGEELSGERLAQVVASPKELGPSAGESRRKLVIGEDAFRGAEGVVQVNQSAGNGNATSNHFGLTVER